MKILKQLSIILIILGVGEYISSLISNIISLPGSIIGMLLMFALLYLKVLKVEHIEEVSDFFLSNIAFFFIPPGVALLDNMGVLKDYWLQLLIIIVLSTIIVLVVTMIVVHFFMRKGGE